MTNAFEVLRSRVWLPGDDPTTHPKWQMQVELEDYMRNAGVDEYRARAVKAQRRGQASRLTPFRRQIDLWLPKIAAGLQEYLRDATYHLKSVGGSNPAAYGYLKGCDRWVVSYISLRAILDHAFGNVSVMTIASWIGREVEANERMLAWERHDPDLWASWQHRLSQQGATAVHRRRVNINRFNALMRDRIEWQDWPDDVKDRIGLTMIDVVIRACGDFELRHELSEDAALDSYANKKLKKTPVRLRLTERAAEWLRKAIDREEILSPRYMPTVIPPMRWSGDGEGGYYTEAVRQPKLIRFKASSPSQQRIAEQEYGGFAMPKVYEALNRVQEVPWRINREVYKVALHFWDHDFATAGFPSRAELPKPKPPEDIETNEEARRAWKREAADTWTKNVQRLNEVKVATQLMLVASKYLDAEAFYFPHMLDFRGRMYAIPHYLQPQGTDVARGLLEFAQAKPITEANGGAGWIAIELANAYGYDKVSFDERIAWVEEREADWLNIADDSLANRHLWMAADKPWQALAAALDWAGFLKRGYGYMSHLAVRVDGTCNGIQHFAAMVRDRETAAMVNLIPSEEPRDIYKEVADKLAESYRKGINKQSHYEWWLNLCDNDIPRSLTKRPVMILPYGGTRHAYVEYTREWLRDEKPEAFPKRGGPEAREEWREFGRNLQQFANDLYKQVGETAAAAMVVMDWLRQCAKFAARGGQPVYWRVPSGFVVRHFYGRVRARRVRTLIDGQTYLFVKHEITDELSEKDQLTGIPPNFVHSLDASAQTEAILLAADRGITGITTIHDNFGSHAADMWGVYHSVREAFVRTHASDAIKDPITGEGRTVLAEFRRACQMVYAGHIAFAEKRDFGEALEIADHNLPPDLPMGDLDIEEVLESDYFFA